MFGLEDRMYKKIDKLANSGDALAMWIIDHMEFFPEEIKDMNSHESKILHEHLKNWKEAKSYIIWSIE